MDDDEPHDLSPQGGYLRLLYHRPRISEHQYYGALSDMASYLAVHGFRPTADPAAFNGVGHVRLDRTGALSVDAERFEGLENQLRVILEQNHESNAVEQTYRLKDYVRNYGSESLRARVRPFPR